MFGVGPMELAVLAIVAVIVVGPERLPGFARQAAQMIRTLRDLSTGARQQLRDELGPEFADVDLRNLNPRTAVRRVLFDDDFDFDSLDPRRRMRDAVLSDEDLRAADPRQALREPVNGHAGSPVRMTKPVSDGLGVPPAAADAIPTNVAARPRPSPRPRPSYDDDIT
jgi:sec-independent protein translocase protein TatB